MAEGGCLMNPFSAGTDFRRPNWTVLDAIPANTKRSANVGTMLGQRRRRWDNFVPTLAERFVFAGMVHTKIFFSVVRVDGLRKVSLSVTVDVAHQSYQTTQDTTTQ